MSVTRLPKEIARRMVEQRPGPPLITQLRKQPGGEQTRRVSIFEDVSPGNVGNVFEIPVSNSGPNAGVNSYGSPVRVLEITGEDRLGEMICVSIQQELVLERAFSLTGSGFPEGPLVGIVEFGAGAGRAIIEFDIPGPTTAPGNLIFYSPFPSSTSTNTLTVAPVTNGVLLSLPASSMRVFVRNDALAPYLINAALNNPSNNTLNNRNLLPGIVRVHATYGTRPMLSRLTRTYPICSNGGLYTNPILAGEGMRIGIPPYAKRVSFPRTGGLSLPNIMPPLNVQFVNLALPGGFPFRGTITIPAGQDGDLPVFPYESAIDFVNPGPDSIDDMVVVFELGI